MARSEYEEVAILRDDESGVVAVITRKIATDFLSYGFMKEFERDGQTVRTSFLSRRHGDAVRRLLPRVEEWIDAEVERSSAARRTAVGGRAVTIPGRTRAASAS